MLAVFLLVCICVAHAIQGGCSCEQVAGTRTMEAAEQQESTQIQSRRHAPSWQAKRLEF